MFDLINRAVSGNGNTDVEMGLRKNLEQGREFFLYDHWIDGRVRYNDDQLHDGISRGFLVS
jgi:hypothetical protein